MGIFMVSFYGIFMIRIPIKYVATQINDTNHINLYLYGSFYGI